MASATPKGSALNRLRPIVAPVDQQQRLASIASSMRIPEDASATAGYQLLMPSGEAIELPSSVMVLVEQLIQMLARGEAVTVVPIAKELTSQQAADILNVSRQYLVRLLDDGRIPHRKSGTHRRVRLDDVLAFKRIRDQERRASLDELSRLSQELGGYDELSSDEK